MIQGLLGKYPSRFLLQSFLLICSFIQHLVPEGLLLSLEGTEMDEWHVFISRNSCGAERQRHMQTQQCKNGTMY